MSHRPSGSSVALCPVAMPAAASSAPPADGAPSTTHPIAIHTAALRLSVFMDVLPGHGAMVSGTTRRLLLSLASYTAPPVSTFRIRK